MQVLRIGRLAFTSASMAHGWCSSSGIVNINRWHKVFFTLKPLTTCKMMSYTTMPRLDGESQSRFECLSSSTSSTSALNSWVTTLPQLFKMRLSAMVICTTLTGFAIIPGIDLYSLNTIKLLFNALLGTTLCSFSANALNQWIEASFDAQMKRTQSRPLPSRRISLPKAFVVSSIMGLGGVGYLYFFVSGLSSIIAASTIVLYAGIYTPMKRTSIMNTWVGSIVGALPPLIGWSAGLQALSYGIPAPSPFGWIPIFFLLYFWQFPHFFSLSWSLRREYARAGYRMCSLLKPKLATTSSLRHTLALFPLTFLFHHMGIADFPFVFIGSLLNCILLFPAIDFKAKQDGASARRLFFASLIYLPLFMVALFLLKSAPQ